MTFEVGLEYSKQDKPEAVDGNNRARTELKDLKIGSCNMSYVVGEEDDIAVKRNDVSSTNGEIHKSENYESSSGTMYDDNPAHVKERKNGAKVDLDETEKNEVSLPTAESLPFKEEYLSDIINGAHGDVYQRDLALLLFERATRKEYDFRLGYEMALADKFDDVVLYDKSKNQWTLVQTKHVDTSKGQPPTPLKFDMLFPVDDAARDKGDFSLFKYLKSYVTVQTNFGEHKNLIIFTNRDFPANDIKMSVAVESRKVDEILLFGHAKHVGLKVDGKLSNEMLNYANRDFISLRDSIVKLFTKGVMDPMMKHYKTPVARMLTKTNTSLKFNENPAPEALQMIESLTGFFNVKTAQLPLAKCGDLFVGKSRHKTLPLIADESTVNQFFQNLILSVRQPDDLCDIVEQDLHLWMRTWIPPHYLMRLQESQLKTGVGRLVEFFNEKQSRLEKAKDGSSYKKFLNLTEGEEFFSSVENDLKRQIRNLSNYNTNDTSEYYVSRQIELSSRMTKLDSDRIRDGEFVEALLSEKFDKVRFLLLTAEPGMGKSTILDYIAFTAQKTSKDSVYLFDLNTFHHKLSKVTKAETVDIFLSVLRPALSDKNFENLREAIIAGKNNETRHLLIFDAFDEVYPDNRFKVLQLFRELLKAEKVQILVSARRTVKATVESEFNIKTMSLVPFDDLDQTNFLRKFWKVTESNEKRFQQYKTHLFEMFHSDINRALVEFTGLPLVLKMLGEVYGDNFDEYLRSEHNNLENVLPREMCSTINLYEQFVRKCFATRMRKKIGNSYIEIDDDCKLLFDNFILGHQLLAMKHLKINVLETIFKDEIYAKTLNRVEQCIKNCTERSALVEAVDNDYRFIHRSYAEFLVAKFLASDMENHKVNLFEELLQASLFLEYPLIRMFFFTLIEAQCQRKHLEIIGSHYLKHSNIALWACEVHGQKTIEYLLSVKCDSSIVNRLLCVASEHDCFHICTYLFENHLAMIESNFNDWKPLEGNYMSQRWNPLHIAASKGHSKVTELIIERSGNVEVQNDRDWTPLHMAAYDNRLDIIQILINKAKENENDSSFKSDHMEGAHYSSDQSADVNATDDGGFTPLFFAAQNGHTDAVKILIEHSANINAKDFDGRTALHIAAESGRTGVVEVLIKNSVDIDATAKNGCTPLHVASEGGCTDIVSLLIDHGWNGNAIDNKSWTPLHYAAQNGHLEAVKKLIKSCKNIDARTVNGRTPFHLACEDGNKEIVKLLIDYPCKVSAKDIFSWTPLHYAAASGNLEVVTLLIDKFEDINEVGCFGHIPLHLAAEYGHTDVVRLLINCSAKVNAKDGDGCTSLYLAAEYGHVEIVKVLISSLADVNAKTAFDRTPVQIAAENGHKEVLKILIANSADLAARGDYGRTAIHYACKNGHSEIVESLIDHFDVNVKDSVDCTPLHYAALNGHSNVVKILVKHFPNVNVKDIKGRIPLHYAAKNGLRDVFELLIDHSSGNVKAKEKIGCTPLHFAAECGHSEIAKTLISDHSVNVNAKNISNWTPLLFAAQNGHSNVVRILIDNFAKVDAKNSKGRIGLHYAAKNGHQDVFNLLLNHCSEMVDAKDNDGRTSLHYASRNGHLGIVKTLTEKHSVDVNAKDVDNWTPLHYAAENGHTNIVLFLIEHLPNVCGINNDGSMPLHYAASNGNQKVVELLIDHSSGNVNVKNNDGCTPLHLACEFGHSKVAKSLIDHFANVNMKTLKGEIPLHFAARNGHQEVAKLLTNHCSEIIDVKDNDSRTSLLYASKNGYSEIVKILIEDLSADMSLKDVNNWTPLHHAAKNGHTSIVGILIDNFASVIEKNNDGAMPLHYAAKNGHQEVVELLIAHCSENVNANDKDGCTPLHFAAKNGHSEVVKLLIHHSANVNAKTLKNTIPLHYAAENGHQNVVQLLIESSPENINVNDSDDRTPLHYAAKNGHVNVSKFLLDHLAYLNAKNQEGAMPLHCAAKNGHQALVELLISRTSVNLKAKDNEGCTPRKLAAKNGHFSAAEFLKREEQKRSLARTSLRWVRQRVTAIRNAVMNISRQS